MRDERLCELLDGINILVYKHVEYNANYFKYPKKLIESNESLKDFILQNSELDVKSTQKNLDFMEFEKPEALNDLLFIIGSDQYLIHSSVPHLIYGFCLETASHSIQIMHEKAKIMSGGRYFDSQVYYSCLRRSDVHKLFYSGLEYPKTSKQIIEANYINFHVSAGDGYIINFGAISKTLESLRNRFKINSIKFLLS